jgi:HSP20 family molecular chaperone IbpA
MRHPVKMREAVRRTPHQDSGDALRQQIPLSDMSDCLLAVYDEVSRRAFQRCSVRGTQEGSFREDWKAAEDDLFARIPVDFEESGGNLYALASLPGCAGREITVAVGECWLLICGDSGHNGKAHVANDFGECVPEERRADSGGNDDDVGSESVTSDEAYASRNGDGQTEISATQLGERNHEYGVPSLPTPRPLCVVALRAKVDPGRSVAVLSNGLLAIRLGNAGLETPVPRVA